MALVGSRVELDADEVRGQAERAGPGAGGRGRDAEPRGGPGWHRGLAGLSFTARSVPRGRAEQSGASLSLLGPYGLLGEPFWTRLSLSGGSSAGCPLGGWGRAA